MSSTSATTMTSALPRTSRPPMAAPTGPLPALPVPKTRTQSSEPIEAPESGRVTPTLSLLPALTPKKSSTPSRSVTASGLPTPKSFSLSSAPTVPALNTTNLPAVSTSPSPPSTIAPPSALPKTIRKVSSIGSFPLPPKGGPRISSLPPSPLSASTSSNENNGRPASAAQKRRDTSKHRSAESGLKKPKTRSSGYGVRPRQSNSNLAGSVSLLNGNGESGLIAGGEGARLAPPSPPQSRSSSADGSYATEATVFEENADDDEDRGRPKSSETVTGTSNRASTSKKEIQGNVLVSVRVRPDAGSDGEHADGEWMVDGRRSLISYKGREGGDYRYDNVFSPHDHNARVYDNAAKRLVRRVMEGYHGTVFAYGMTGTGKTFSMQGTANSPGVIPLAITDIFSYIRENPSREFLLRVSYLEIYNEKIYDLLSQSSGQTQQEEIKLREDSRRGVYATPLKEEIVQSPNQLLRVISRGDQARRVGSTQFNARSSRSHAVVQIVVESRERTPNHGQYFEKETRRGDRIMPGGVLVSTLSLIDLAGSERAAENKERRQEGAHINKSLLTLGTVIARLSTDDEKGDKEDGKGAEREKNTKHLPYRDSKLTRLLQPALSGNSLVSILCTIQLSSAGTSAAQSTSHTGETLNTLKFASRAKNNIVSHAKRNESGPNSGDPGSRALLERYRMEIQDLRKQLDSQSKVKVEVVEEKTDKPDDELEEDRKREEELEREEQNRHEEQMLEMQLARTALKERIGHLNRLILSSKSLGVNSGRFSSSSIPINRMSTYSVMTDTSRPISLRSRDSLHSTHTRDSTATLEVPSHLGESLSRTLSSGSVTTGTLPVAQPSQLTSEENTNGEDEDGDGDDIDGEGTASLAQQNRMLQADLVDKNRYITTLEKRLLQARRTSHSRVSIGLASRVGSSEEGTFEALLREKDREIDELRAKLDDQMRMVTALRSAARKRDMVDGRRKSQQTTFSDETARPSTSNGETDTLPELGSPAFRRQNSSRTSNYSSNLASNSPTTTVARSSNGVTFAPISKNPLSPMAILSPTRTSLASDDGSHHFHTNHFRASGGRDELRASTGSRRKSVDEMTQLLDQMIQDKVESGHIVRGERNSLRVRHDTVIQDKLEPAALIPTAIPEDQVMPHEHVLAENDSMPADTAEESSTFGAVATPIEA